MGKSDIVRDRIKGMLTERPGILQSQIAAELDLTPQTVSKHVKAIRQEWQAGNMK